MNPIALLLLAVGLFSTVGAIMDWDWFVNHARADVIRKLTGSRRGTRLFYLILGLVLTVAGAAAMAGWIDLDALSR